MTKRHCWVCPECGAGKLAPSKPRKNDIRRFCLPCSEKTGFLVERSCPVLDDKRARKQEKAKAKRQREREKRRQEKQDLKEAEEQNWWVGRFHLKQEFDRLLKLSGWKRPVTLRVLHRKGFWSTGHCTRHKITLTAGYNDIDALATLVHEVGHLLHMNHSAAFWQAVHDLAEKAWPEMKWQSYSYPTLGSQHRQQHLAFSLWSYFEGRGDSGT